jgi:uncharacterized protein
MTPINDVHCHFFSSGFLAALGRQRGDAEPSAHSIATELGWEAPGDPEHLADRWVGELDRAGVARVALIASIPGDEDSVAAAVRRHPSRFVGFFMVDPTAPDALARVERALAGVMRVVCLFPAMHRYALYDERVQPLVEAVASTAGAAVFAHCGLLTVGVRRKLGLASPFESRFGNPLDLQGLATRHPSVPFIVPHFGAGLFREALMLAEACPNVRLDTSSSNAWIRYFPGLTLAAVYATALEVVGPERLLFGTDSSFFPRGWQRGVYDDQRAALERLGVPEEVRTRIFGGNFGDLFAIGEERRSD